MWGLDWLRLPRQPAKRKVSAQLIAPLGEFGQAELKARKASPAKARLLRAGRRSSSEVDQIGAAVSARMILAEDMSIEELIRYVQHLQNRYRVAVGATTYARYAEGVPKDLFDIPHGGAHQLWAELQTLSYRLRLAYSITYIRDRHLGLIRAVCAWTLAIALVIVIGALACEEWTSADGPILNVAIVAVVGLGGAVTSIARRAHQILATGPLEDDPVVQASALEQGSASLFVAGLTGPVFALVLLLVFLGGALSVGELTPHFIRNTQVTDGRPADFRVFQYHFWFKDPFDAAKLVLWSFVSGFAEQLVPDVLDRFARGPQSRDKGSSRRDG